MRFSYEWVKELGKLRISANEAAELLTARTCETEVLPVSSPERGVYDYVLNADILPNRPDLLSHVGLARELAALTNSRFTEPADAAAMGHGGAVSVTVQDARACPRYSGLVVRGVTVGPSPDWMRDILERLEVKSINNVVDAVNYVMLERGQPMHAFDLSRLQGGIEVRFAKNGERIRTLDEARTEYVLDPSVLVIADRSGPVAIAGIKGGVGTAVSEATHNVFLEAAAFSADVVRAATGRLALRTDASVRFAYGVSPAATAATLARAAQVLTKVAGGTSDEAMADVYPHPWHPSRLMLNAGYARSLLGADIANNEMVASLSALGFAVSGSGANLEASVPSWRLDVHRQEDLIEEVGRMYGYENIPARPPVVHAYDERSWVRDDEDVAWDGHGHIRERHSIVRLLAAAGFTEVYNYSFYSDELKETLKADHAFELEVPQSSQYRWLRTSILPRLVLTARDNLRHARAVRLVETGHVFDHVNQGIESVRLGMTIAHAGDAGRSEAFYELKGAVDALLREKGITDAEYDDAEPFSADRTALTLTAPGRRANIKDSDGNVLGFIGMVHPAAAATLKLKGSAAVAELNLRALIRHAQGEREYEPLPKYPAVERDISMLVADDVRVGQILEVIERADTAGLVQDVDVIDIFVPTGDEKLAPEYSRHEYGKSIAVRVVYRADDRTLTDEEVSSAEDRIKKALQDELAAQIR